MSEAPYDWFFAAVDRLRDSGVQTQVTSGMACVFRQKTSTHTKDCDIIIPSQWGKAIEILSNLKRNGSPLLYRSPFSAPLSERWMSSGWTAHLEWLGDPVAKLDIFGVPPRVLNPIGSDYFSNDETIASIKMTQRIRDWAVVHEMGLRLVQQKNPKGLLYLQTSEVLQKSLQEFEAASIGALAAYRPILRIATTLSSVKLQAFLNIERNFWMILDNKRLTIFRKACASYLKPARAVLDSEQSFEKQHEKLLLVADRYLPDNPLVGKIDSIVHLAAEEAFEAIDRSIFGTELLPCVWAAATLRVSNIQET